VSDGRLKTLKRADPVEMDVVQKRYAHIADTIDDAVTKLQQIVDAGEDGLRGEYVTPLKKDATSLKDSLTKAARRYRDVATECAKYEPELQIAIDQTRAAEGQEADGDAALTRANAMPDPQKGPDGTISPEEQQKGHDKEHAQQTATGDITAAKNKLTAALDALDVAGKAFGDAVNCKKYDDGLTDKINWRVMAIFKMISKIFGIIALILAVFAFIIPGVGLLALASVVATAVLLVADSVLLAGGDGSVLSVILDVVGLGFAGLGALAGKFAKMFEGAAKFWKGTLPSMFFKIKPGGGISIELGPIGKPLLLTGPKPGFFQAGWNWLTGGSGNFWKGWMNGLWNFDALKGLDFLKTLGLGALGPGFVSTIGAFKWIMAGWGGINQFFNFGAGVVIGILQVIEFQGLDGV
jgi:hypothetical protein